MTRPGPKARRSGKNRRSASSAWARAFRWLQPAPPGPRRPQPAGLLRRLVDELLVRDSRRSQRRSAIVLIGLDVSRPPLRLQTRSWIPSAAALLLGGLFLTTLRMDVTRMRLQLGHAFKEELRLEEIERQLTVDMRRLRDPAVLTRRAAEGGFGRADRLIDLEGPPSRAGLPGPRRRSIALAVTRSGARR